MNIYLASPYTSNSLPLMEERYEKTLDATGFLADKYRNQHVSIYSPIVSWHNVAKRFNLPRDNGFWRDLNRPFIDLYMTHFAVLCLQGWDFSEGIRDEYSRVKLRIATVTFFIVPMTMGFSTVVKGDGEEYESRIARLDRSI